MTNEEFMKEIFEPYNAAYRIIKDVWNAKQEDEEKWEKYIEDVDAYHAKYNKNKYVSYLESAIYEAVEMVKA